MKRKAARSSSVEARLGFKGGKDTIEENVLMNECRHRLSVKANLYIRIRELDLGVEHEQKSHT